LPADGLKALAAVDRLVLLGQEGKASGAAAHGAGGLKELAGTRAVFAGVAARFAAIGLVNQAAGGVEFLLAGGENEFSAALSANEGLVLVHGCCDLLLVPANAGIDLQTVRGGRLT